MHFVVVQVFALLVAVVVLATHDSIKGAWASLRPSLPLSAATAVRFGWSAVGFLVVVYPIITAVGATFWVFRQVELFIKYAQIAKRQKRSSGRSSGPDRGDNAP